MESIHELLANDLVNASVPICWETHITAFNSSGGTDISGGVAGDMCSGEQKIRGNTYLRYTGSFVCPHMLVDGHYSVLNGKWPMADRYNPP